MAAPLGNQNALGSENSGRPKAIETPEEMMQHYSDYKQFCVDNPLTIEDYVGKDAQRVMRQKPRAISYDGFCVWLWDNSIIRDPDHYFRNLDGRYVEFIPICQKIKRDIRNHQIEGAMGGIYNVSITQRLNGLVEKTDNKNENTNIEVVAKFGVKKDED